MANVLVVDDESEVLNTMQLLLNMKGYEVLTAQNGHAALDSLENGKVDAVLLDVKMPGEIDGYEVCRRIKNDKRYKNLPVIMVTALSAKQDRIKGIEAGADDFISKPVDHHEVLARTKMLLKMKENNDRLSNAYDSINSLISYCEHLIQTFNPMDFDYMAKIDGIVDHIISKTSDVGQRPKIVLVGYVTGKDNWQWYQYESVFRELNRTLMNMDIQGKLPALKKSESKSGFVNKADIPKSEIYPFITKLQDYKINVNNVVYYLSEIFCIFSINYGREVIGYDASVINSFVVSSMFLKSISSSVNSMVTASTSAVYALARASDINDEGTGKHILRVGEYCAVIARELKLPEQFVWIIRIQASLHDVGKLRIPSAILKKPGRLTDGELDSLKRHTIYGAEIIGDNPTLSIARAIALTHHEKWDGNGYPYGLKGEKIPMEGRIFTIADQYDVLRTRRIHKNAFGHSKAFDILTKGDGRTLPSHFDPRVLAAFKRTAAKFNDIYERLKD